jgi:serine/threonine-protein kinase HSL1, negative regulator of Swe1 kinase
MKTNSRGRPNDQKLFYWLLLNYREEKLENYDTDLTYSASDYHHLRPSHWKRKLTTAEFPSRYGRTPSRFTVISTVPTDGSIDEADNATDGGATILSYDPYKASRIIENVYASHAKIIVHRNYSTAHNSSRSSASRRAPNGSCRSGSTSSRPPRASRRITAPAALRPSGQSLSSIQSGESAPYTRPASRRKRGVDFSHVRSPSKGQNEVTRPWAKMSRDTTYSYDYASPIDSFKGDKVTRGSNGRRRSGTQSMMSIPQMEQDSTQWSEEVREFSHSIAKDCDDAFNSSLLSAQSCLGNVTNESPLPVEAAQYSAGLATPSPGIGSNANVGNDVHPWDRRPLPPTPASSESTVRYVDHVMPLFSGAGQARNLDVEDEPSRRTVSAPIYSQYSTQWGKDKIPLPPINEKYRDDSRGRDNDKPRTVSAPVGNGKGSSVHMDERAGLEFLAQHENTIRIVDSPAGKPSTEAGPPKPSALRKQLSRGATAYSQSGEELDLRRRYVRDEPNDTGSRNKDVLSTEHTTSGPTRKKSSWFKRSSKDREDVFDTKEDTNSSRTDRLTYTSTNSSGGPAIPPAKKKSFNIAFWRNSKDASEMQMSLAGKGEPCVRQEPPRY